MADLTDLELLDALGVAPEARKQRARTPREERIVAGFEDIVRFREEHGRAPRHGEDRDIFERVYAVRLERLRALPEAQELLAGADRFGLLTGEGAAAVDVDELDDAALLAELGVEAAAAGDDITQLRHVASREEKRAAEEIADRTPCADFAAFEPRFEQVRRDLASGLREARPIKQAELTLAEIKPGEFFVVGGQIAYVGDAEDAFRTDYDRTDRRLRVIYDNGTESNLFARSLQKALYRDDAGRRITNPAAGPLFGGTRDEEDLESGLIYVLRSRSAHPKVAANRDLIHKIGVTGGTVEARIAGAAHDATYLLADVEVVATYRLFNINRARLEHLIHRVFATARLDLTIHDRFGHPVQPREWFLVPLPVIDQVVERIKDGSIKGLAYDPATASLVADGRG